MNQSRSVVPWSCLLLLGFVGAEHKAAADFLSVDQQNLPTDTGDRFGINLDNGTGPGRFGRIAQTFTPQTSRANAVSFFLQDSSASDGLGLSVFVELVSPDLEMVLATSETLTLSNGHGFDRIRLVGEETVFNFTPTLSLTPGVEYAARLRKAAGGRFWVIGSRQIQYDFGVYTGGSGDLFFRQGVVIPEPASTALLIASLLSGLVCVGTNGWRGRVVDAEAAHCSLSL